MNKQGYEELIQVLTRVINKQQVTDWGLCGEMDHIEGARSFLEKQISLWEDKAASGSIAYPIAITGRFNADREFWQAEINKTMYADTPYGDARRRLAAFLRSKAEEELELLVGAYKCERLKNS